MSSVETGQVSAVETGQASTAETGQMSAVETRQMHSNIAAAGGRLIGSLGYILAVLGCRTGPRGEKMVARSRGTDSQDLATILYPFRAIFIDLGPNRLSAT